MSDNQYKSLHLLFDNSSIDSNEDNKFIVDSIIKNLTDLESLAIKFSHFSTSSAASTMFASSVNSMDNKTSSIDDENKLEHTPSTPS